MSEPTRTPAPAKPYNASRTARREPPRRAGCPGVQQIRGRRPGPPASRQVGPMDAHTLELLEFDKVRELVAGYAACSLGKDLARQLEPLGDAEEVRAELALVSEMADALGGGLSPPFGGLHDVRLTVRRAAI